MEEDIKIIEDLIKQNKGAIKEAKASKDINSMNLIADMDSQNKALEHLIQAYKEDKAVIYYMIEDIRKRSIDCVYSHEELEKIYRNKVKELGWLDE